MSTRRGPKVEPHENPLIENKVFEQPQEEVKKVHVILQEDDVKEVEKLHNVVVEDEINKILSEEVSGPKEVHFEFQKDYFLGCPSSDEPVKIDALPQPQKRKKRMDELNQTELRTYQKTGFLPEI
jgi:hypothetical protein